MENTELLYREPNRFFELTYTPVIEKSIAAIFAAQDYHRGHLVFRIEPALAQGNDLHSYRWNSYLFLVESPPDQITESLDSLRSRAIGFAT